MIAITGGAGAMGTRLSRLLRSRGFAVRILDRVEPPDAGVDFRRVDVSDRASLSGCLEGVDAVVHLAALILAKGDDRLLEDVNAGGTENLLEECRVSGVRRFVHVSSISVAYPESNAYSASKRRSEEIVRGSGLAWTVLRPTLAWGDPAAAEYRTFARAVERWPVLPLPGGGRAVKAPVHVDDLASAFARALERGECVGKTLDLPGSREVSLARMASEIRLSSGSRGVTVSVSTALARSWARAVAPVLRRFGAPPLLDWQTFTGLVQDARPSAEEARRILDWDPRPWRAEP